MGMYIYIKNLLWKGWEIDLKSVVEKEERCWILDDKLLKRCFFGQSNMKIENDKKHTFLPDAALYSRRSLNGLGMTRVGVGVAILEVEYWKKNWNKGRKGKEMGKMKTHISRCRYT